MDRHDPLAFMARYFNALEVNVSFYRDVNAAMAASWLRRVAHFRDFQFTAKLHQRFTHARRDSFPTQEVISSLAGLEPLREARRLGALLAQFPWSYRDQGTFVFTNNHFRGQAPANALELKAKLAGEPVEVPDTLLAAFPVLGKFARPSKHEHQGRLFQ